MLPPHSRAILAGVTAPRKCYNIALVGFMGTGKTSVGSLVASLLHFQMLDTDQMIEEGAGRSISQIFAQDGEPKFRALERQVVESLAGTKGAVISTGGGLAANRDNLENLKKHSLVVCLWASPETIWERVRHQSHRPLLHDPQPQEKIRRLLAEREPFYRQADVLIGTDQRSVREIASHIRHHWDRQQ